MRQNKIYFLIAIAFFIMLAVTFGQCKSKGKWERVAIEERMEKERMENNFLASQDTLRTYIEKDGTNVAEISAYKLTEKELREKYSKLFGEYTKVKNQPPTSIVKTEYVIVEDIKDFDISASQDGERGKLSFASDTLFSDGNVRKISGEIPFEIYYFRKTDSLKMDISSISEYAKVYPGEPSLHLEQQMQLITGLRRDENTGRYYVWAQTDYPGVSFTSLVGADIEQDPLYEDLKRELRKSWGIGLQLGAGIVYSVKDEKFVPGISLGIGVNFTPKITQFGK
jgi:hypothetical protein